MGALAEREAGAPESAGAISDPSAIVLLGDALGCAIVVRPSGMLDFIIVQGIKQFFGILLMDRGGGA